MEEDKKKIIEQKKREIRERKKVALTQGYGLYDWHLKFFKL